MITFTLQALPYCNSDEVHLSSDSQEKVYVALYPYKARTDNDLSFEKGERLLVLNREDEGWWFARSLKSQEEGYIPKNYVSEENDAQAEE